ncbi:MAG: ABC transporter ATP-binding protein [Dermatophilaceae bacterium]
MSAPVIEIQGLSKSYRGVPAVHDVSLTVEQGEVFALLGPNGAGKTTTVEICAGFRRADTGYVRVLGADPSSGDPAWKDRFGIVTQHSNDLEDLTVTEAVQSIAWCYSAPRPVGEVIAAVGLTDKATARCVKLSGGQRRRLDVALGLVGNPSLLLLDEPTTGFDPEARRAFWELIRSLGRQGMTILLTTHYLDEAEQLADRVGVIAAGRVLEINTPAAIGGRDTSGTRVQWSEDGQDREVFTAQPTATVMELSARFGGEVPGLRVERPSLEDVYLAMIASVQPSGEKSA